jgi:hypothetical protein
MRVSSFERRVIVIGGCTAAVGAAGTFLVVRFVSRDGGGYSDFFFALGLLAIIFLAGSVVELLRVARAGDSVGAAVCLSLAASVVLVVLGAGVGLRG